MAWGIMAAFAAHLLQEPNPTQPADQMTGLPPGGQRH